LSSERGSSIFAYTATHGHKPKIAQTISKMRATAGCWFDWGVWAGRPSPETETLLHGLLFRPDRLGIQALRCWPENRGQHHATREALAHARLQGYDWLLRIDDDIQPKTPQWLDRMLQRLAALRTARAAISGDAEWFVSSPRIVGLKNPLKPEGELVLPGIKFPVDVMPILGGAVRLHPLGLLEGYEPPLLAPKGRGDPGTIGSHVVVKKKGLLIRFPDIRVIHDTASIEAADSPDDTVRRKMGYVWPYLGTGSPTP